MKKFIAVILSATTILSCSTNAFAQETKTTVQSITMEIKNDKNNNIVMPTNISIDNTQKVFINDKQLELKDGSIIYENRLYLPVREISEALGLDVNYIADEKIVDLENGKIQLPVGQNKAVVDGKIIAIDKENNKVGTIVLNSKTYLPVRFISENLSYEVSFDANSKTTYIKTMTPTETITDANVTKLEKNEAVETYKKLSEENNNIKNLTTDMSIKMDMSLSDGTDTMEMKTNVVSTAAVDIKDNIKMNIEQKVTVESLGEKETVDQKIYYKDGKMYTSQTSGGQTIKLKTDLKLEEAMNIANSTPANNILNDEILKEMILDGTVKTLENGNKQYTFNLDMGKTLDSAKEMLKEFFSQEDLALINNIKISNSRITLEMDKENKPVSNKVLFSMSLKAAEELEMKVNVDADMNYKNIGTTVVNIPEDLSEYKDVQ